MNARSILNQKVEKKVDDKVVRPYNVEILKGETE